VADARAEFIVGLDLGQAADFTALAVARRSPALDADGRPLATPDGRGVPAYAIVHLERYALGTPYPAIVSSVCELVKRPELGGNPTLAVDATGCGRPVVDMFISARPAARLHPVTITAGSEVRRDAWGSGGASAYWVPKRDLAGAVQALLQSGRLKVAPALPLAETLRRELANFRVKISAAANETFEAWREHSHDDLVLAVAMACYMPIASAGQVRLGPAVGTPPIPGMPRGYPQPAMPRPMPAGMPRNPFAPGCGAAQPQPPRPAVPRPPHGGGYPGGFGVGY
jgi:hypothetical protein